MVDHVLSFHGDNHLATHHVTYFMDFISKLNMEHEDVVMRMFLHVLVGDTNDWFKIFGKGEINSFIGLIKEFHEHWDLVYEKE
jgi:hypothetical protein